MRNYVENNPDNLNTQINEIALQVDPLLRQGNYQDAEGLIAQQYRLIRNSENELIVGHRHHKGAELYNWGVSILAQRLPTRTSEGIKKIILAFIEDLYDFPTIDDAISAPAAKFLQSSPYIKGQLFEEIKNEVVSKIDDEEIVKDPEQALSENLSQRITTQLNLLSNNRRKLVFLVHGRNIEFRNAVMEFLLSLGLIPFTLKDVVPLVGSGAPHPSVVLNVAFSIAHAIVVLMTPDDKGYLCKRFRGETDGPKETYVTSQARQNVVFEAGMAIGGQFPNSTVLVEPGNYGNLRPISDINGFLVVALDNTLEKRENFRNHLIAAHCSINATTNAWTTAGDFTIPEEKGIKKTIKRTIECLVSKYIG